MGEIIEVTDYVLVADDSWRDRLAKAKDELAKRTIPAFIDFCKEVHEFRVHCDSSQGGSEFSRKGCEWLGCTPAMLTRWSAVGRRESELFNSLKSLPASETTISDLAMLDDIAFPIALEKLEPDMTQAQVKELIKEVNPPVQRTAVEQEDKDRKKAARMIKDFEALPRKFQYVVWDSIHELCEGFD